MRLLALLLPVCAWLLPANVIVAHAAGPVVAGSIHNDTSSALSAIPTHGAPGVPSEAPEPGPLPRPAGSPRPAPASPLNTTRMPAAGPNFDGMGQGFSGPQGAFKVSAAPPDTNGAVGPGHYVQVVNASLTVFAKTGSVLLGPVSMNTLWSGFGGLCQSDNDGDPVVRYDRLAGRWVILQFAVTGANGSSAPYLICVAVSSTGDPTGSYHRYSFGYSNFPDYPKLGVWPDGYYLTLNMFNPGLTAFVAGEVSVLDRTAMLSGLPATTVSFTTNLGGMVASDLDGSTPPPTGSPAYLAALGGTASTLAVFQLHADFASPSRSTLSGPGALDTLAFADACGDGTCIPQAGTTQQLDSLADRLMFRLAYRNFGDHQSLVLSHSVTAGSSTGVRWYELRASGGALSIYQQGTYAPDARFRWMPSIAMDRAGDIAVGYSVSGPSVHPGIHYSGRLAGDPLGTISQSEAVIVDGAGSQTTALSRWGDYSSMDVDPADDCTFWYTTEYVPADGTFNWRTRVAAFRFPSCGTTAPGDFAMSISPTSRSVTAGTSTTYTVGTAATAAPVPATPAAPAAPAVPGGGTNGAPAGSIGISVSLPGISVTVGPIQVGTGAPPPPSDPTPAGPVTVALAASGVPAGASASLSPRAVTAGGSSTLTVTTAPTTPAGTYTIRVTGTGPSTTHSVTATLVVTAPTVMPGGVGNGGFEAGSLGGWTTAGVVRPVAVTSPVHGGSFAARLGSPTAFAGDSTLSQSVAIPSGARTLSFWYRPYCPDLVYFDQQQAQIRSTSGATLATIMNVCGSSGVWTNVLVDIRAWAGQTVVLYFNAHDDGHAADPTYFFLDDVNLS